VFDHSALVICDSFLTGINGVVFCYGQTGSGKTHTMYGPDVGTARTDCLEASTGIIPRVLAHVFAAQAECRELTLSYCELYNENLVDLLADPADAPLALTVRGGEDPRRGVYVEGTIVTGSMYSTIPWAWQSHS
jgi:hypothetical protein